MEVKEKDELEIDLKEIVFVIAGRLRTIVLIGVLFALASLLVSQLLITPKYASTTSFYVMNQQDENKLTISDLNVSTTLTSDFEIMVTSRTVLEAVIETLGLETNAEELAKTVSTNNPTGTRMLEITITHEDPYQAKLIADALADKASEQIQELMGIEKVNIIDYGNIADNPSTPNIMQNVIIAAVIGLALTIVVVICAFIFDDTIRTPEDVERLLGVSVLGIIPLSDEESAGNGKSNRAKKRAIAAGAHNRKLTGEDS